MNRTAATTPTLAAGQRGFSMIELMMSIAILTVIMGGIVALLQHSQMIFKNERNVLDSVQDLRGAFEMLTQEVMLAGTGQVSDFGIVAGTQTSLTVRGNFDSVSSIALTLDSTSGTIVLGSADGFAQGQTVALSDPNGGKAVWTTVNSVSSATKTIVVSTNATSITSGATLSDFGPGTLVDLIERIQYTIDNTGTLTRTISSELNTSSATTTTLAENVLDAQGNVGITFAYSDSLGAAVATPITSTNAASVALVTIGLKVRTKDLDSQTHSYRNYALTTYVRPRS